MHDVIIIIYLIPIVLLAIQVFTYPFQRIRLSLFWLRLLLDIGGLFSILILLYLLWLHQSFGGKLVFDLSVTINIMNIYLGILVLLLLFIVTRFTLQYLHTDVGFHKFILNITLFWLGQILFLYSKTYLYRFAGWEFVGISSIFLIAFYKNRKQPVRNALYTMSFYKIADILLLTALIFISSHSFDHVHSRLYSELIASILVIAGLIKSGSFPFTVWLPRSMEGPTPSSAVFYGSLSVNIGIILIYQERNLIQSSNIASLILLVSALFTILYSTIRARIMPDVKRAIVYATSAQNGIILLELYFGFSTLAMVHLGINSIARTYQFITSPNLLHLYHHIEVDYGNELKHTGLHYNYLVPKGLRNSLYSLAQNDFYLDDLIAFIHEALRRIAIVFQFILSPFVNREHQASYSLLIWVFYYVAGILLIDQQVINLGSEYTKFVPYLLLAIALIPILKINMASFISLLVFYKFFEGLITHATNNAPSLDRIAIIVMIIFIILLVKLEVSESHQFSLIEKCLLISSMLFFTNFPFLQQSMVNEKILEHFLSESQYISLIAYSIANTLFNITLYRYVFNGLYIENVVSLQNY